MKTNVIITDRSLLVALVIKYSIYAIWGLIAFFTGITTIERVYDDTGESIWAGLVGIFSFAIVLFIVKGWEKAESFVTIPWLAVVILYPLSLIYRLSIGDLDAPHLIVLGFGYLVIPSWRLQFLIRKNLKPKALKA